MDLYRSVFALLNSGLGVFELFTVKDIPIFNSFVSDITYNGALKTKKHIRTSSPFSPFPQKKQKTPTKWFGFVFVPPCFGAKSTQCHAMPCHPCPAVFWGVGNHRCQAFKMSSKLKGQGAHMMQGGPKFVGVRYFGPLFEWPKINIISNWGEITYTWQFCWWPFRDGEFTWPF